MSSGSARFDPAVMQLMAAQMGIEGLDNATAGLLADDIGYRLRGIVHLATKFMRHSQRETLVPEDIDCALRVLNVESLYGYASSDPVSFEQAEGRDDLFYVKDQLVSFEKVLKTDPPPCPGEPTFSVHWLAVEGQQPNIEQNPVFSNPFEESSESDEDGDEPAGDAAVNPVAVGSGARAPTKAAMGGGEGVKKLVKHVLSKEQQLFYDEVTKSVKTQDSKQLPFVLDKLENEEGLHQMLPYMVQFIEDEVLHNLRNLPLLNSLMRMTRALLASKNLCLEPYVHQLLPAIVTCLCGRYLCRETSDNHWALRDFAAELVALVCRKFGPPNYPNLMSRVVRQLLQAFLDVRKPLTTHYGAIVGLSALGVHVVSCTIMPRLAAYLELLRPSLSDANPQKSVEARRVYGALLRATGACIRQHVYQFEYNVLLERVLAKTSGTKVNPAAAVVVPPAAPPSAPAAAAAEPEAKAASSSGRSRRSKRKRGGGDHVSAAQANPKKRAKASRSKPTPRAPNAISANGNAASDVLPGCAMSWKSLYDLFGEEVLPYLRVNLCPTETLLEGSVRPVSSVSDLFL